MFNSGREEVLKLELIFSGGKYAEKIPESSFFAVSMLAEGSNQFSSEAFNNLFDHYGAFYEFHTGLDQVALSVYCPSEHLSDLVPSIADMLLSPLFPEEKLKKLKFQRENQLLLQLEQSSFWANRLFRTSIFGEEHPYGAFTTKAHIHSINISHLENYYNSVVNHHPFEILLSGKFDSEKVNRLLEQAFGDIPMTEADPLAPLGKPEKFHQRVEKHLDHLNQASISMGQVCIPLTHPDYPAFLLTNKLLGGFFGSRLMKTIREEKGLTYGIYSVVRHFQHSSIFQIMSDVKINQSSEVIELIGNEMNLIRSGSPEEDELDLVRNYLIGEFNSNLNTAFDHAEKFKMIHSHGLSMDFYTSLLNRINKITPEKISEIALKYLDPNGMTVVEVI